MENDSTSATSPAWPTRWPSNSFRVAPTLGFVFAAAGLFLAVLFIGAFVAAWWLYAHHHGAEITATARNQSNASPAVFMALSTAQGVAEALLVLAIVAAMPLLSHFSRRELGFRAITLPTIGWALLGAVGMVIVADVASSVIQSLFPHLLHAQAVEKIFRRLRNVQGGIAFFFVYAVIVQPVAEETVFRVLIFNVALRYGGFWFGAIVSGALFGAVHTLTGSADVVSGVLLGLGGMVLCAVYYFSRNAYASMISHGLFNGLSIALIYFFPKVAGG